MAKVEVGVDEEAIVGCVSKEAQVMAKLDLAHQLMVLMVVKLERGFEALGRSLRNASE